MERAPDDFRHHSHRRKRSHDYREPWKYHITIMKAPGCPPFGRLTGDLALASRNPDNVKVALSRLGFLIAAEVRAIPRLTPEVEVYQYVVMPDHVHILLRVKEAMEKPLGYVIGNLTGRIGRQWRAVCGDPGAEIFEEGFNDRIIYPHRSLDAVFRYIRHNPYRLAVRQCRPGFFTRARNIVIDGKGYDAYGNMFLLRNPFKSCVVVHRADSEAVRAEKMAGWLHVAANGGVLVSPFISPAEKAVRRMAEEAGGKIILIMNEAMTGRFKPSGHDFELCVAGRLLMISTATATGDKPSRGECLAMNRLAASLAWG